MYHWRGSNPPLLEIPVCINYTTVAGRTKAPPKRPKVNQKEKNPNEKDPMTREKQ